MMCQFTVKRLLKRKIYFGRLVGSKENRVTQKVKVNTEPLMGFG